MVAAMLVQRSSIGCTQCNCFPAAATPLSIASRSPLRILCVFVLPFSVCIHIYSSSSFPYTHMYNIRSYVYIIIAKRKKNIYTRTICRKKYAQDKGPFGNPNTSVTSLHASSSARIRAPRRTTMTTTV